MRTKLLLFFSFVFSTTYAQINFQDHLIANSENSTLGASSVYAADLDGDGDLDMLSTSYWDNKIAWYENTDGLGNFGGQQIISVQTVRAESVIASDVDGDGDQDVLSASLYDDKIAWYENTDGLGNFGPQQIISTNVDLPYEVFSADIDGDGDLDVLSASGGDDKIAWYENLDGSGSFGTQQTITTDADDARKVITADLDGDGDLDVLSASNGDDKIAWYENTDGTGAFGPQELISSTTDRASAIYATDLDGDGDLDVLSASYQDGIISWYENTDGLANFGPEEIITNSALMATSIIASDVDNDNDMDVVFASAYNGGKLAWFENVDGLGTFGTEQILTINVSYPKNIYVADLNGDGNEDLLSASETDDKIAWYENLGQGNFGPQINLTPSVMNAFSVSAADLNGDGFLDAISASRDDGKVAWYENDGQGNFGEQEIVSPYMVEVTSIFAQDLDGDGDVDVLSTSWSSDKVFWNENLDGTGNSWDSHEITDYLGNVTADGVYWVCAADLDSDDDPDVLSASGGDDKIAWYKNLDGQGDFGVQQVISNSNGFGLQEVHTGDLDNDGDLDVVAIWNSDAKIAWFENMDGAGNFGSQQNIATNINAPYAIYPSDLDNDGDLDILASALEKLVWFENNGSGNFGAQQLIAEDGNSSSMVHATDIDADGDLDVLYGGLYENNIRWYENDGMGNFGTQQLITTNSGGTRSLFSADLDSDGYMDILSAAWKGNPNFEGGNKIMWYENLSGLSIHENSKKTFSLYPNPTNGIVQINSETPVKEIEIHNSLGQFIFVTDQNQIDLSKLSNGIYFLKITGQNGNSETKKIVKK